MKTIIVSILGLLCSISHAQQLKADLLSLSHASSKPRAFELNYESYRSHDSELIDEEAKALYASKATDHYCLKNALTLTLREGRDQLVVDNEQSRIFFIRDSIAPLPFNMSNLDTALTLSKSIDLIEEGSNFRTYEIIFDSPFLSYNKMVLSVDTKSWYIRMIQFDYRLSYPIWEDQKITGYYQPKMVIRLKPREFDHEMAALLELDNYILNINNKYTPSPKYKDYEVIANL